MSNTNLVAEILAFAGGGTVGGGTIAALVTGLFGRGINSAHTAQIVTDMYAKADEGNQKRIERLDAEIKSLVERLERCDMRNEALEARNEALDEQVERQRNRIGELVALIRDDLIPQLEDHGVDVTAARAVLGAPGPGRSSR